MATSEAQMKSEIARLTASINMHKANAQTATDFRSKNTHMNPNSKYANSYSRPSSSSSYRTPTPQARQQVAPTQVKEVTIGGVAFQSSGRSLVRKDLSKTPPAGPSHPPRSTPLKPPQYVRKSGQLVNTSRVYKPKSSRGRARPTNKNMTLTNTRRPRRSRLAAKKLKYQDKPCPQFTTTGACNRGLTCFYKHNPDKIAICWNFLLGNCPNSAASCNLSHEPTPERTPLCMHFVKGSRCSRPNCPFPHVNVGPRDGVCRDFAVLGYCEKGLDCDKQHIRECPDFAEKGACSTKGCKLPHVIRANRHRTVAPTAISDDKVARTSEADAHKDGPLAVFSTTGEIGDEYISLTFNESESEEEEDESDDDEEEGEGPSHEEEDDDEMVVHT